MASLATATVTLPSPTINLKELAVKIGEGLENKNKKINIL